MKIILNDEGQKNHLQISDICKFLFNIKEYRHCKRIFVEFSPLSQTPKGPTDCSFDLKGVNFEETGYLVLYEGKEKQEANYHPFQEVCSVVFWYSMANQRLCNCAHQRPYFFASSSLYFDRKTALFQSDHIQTNHKSTPLPSSPSISLSSVLSFSLCYYVFGFLILYYFLANGQHILSSSPADVRTLEDENLTEAQLTLDEYCIPKADFILLKEELSQTQEKLTGMELKNKLNEQELEYFKREWQTFLEDEKREQEKFEDSVGIRLTTMEKESELKLGSLTTEWNGYFSSELLKEKREREEKDDQLHDFCEARCETR